MKEGKISFRLSLLGPHLSSHLFLVFSTLTKTNEQTEKQLRDLKIFAKVIPFQDNWKQC